MRFIHRMGRERIVATLIVVLGLAAIPGCEPVGCAVGLADALLRPLPTTV